MTSQGQRDESKRRDQAEDGADEVADSPSEMSRFLQKRKWEVQEGPFQGFGSPPGRF